MSVEPVTDQRDVATGTRRVQIVVATTIFLSFISFWRAAAIVLADLKRANGVVKKNAGASLVDLGDGVLCCEFHSKMNAIGEDIIHMLNIGLAELNKNFEALRPWREKGSALPVFAVQNLIAGGMEMDVLDQTPNITCPTLFLTGDEDVLTPLSYAHELQRRIRGSQILMLREAGHCMFLEQPAQFTRAAAEFLTRALL
jgi:pimeloyl-ACP methyl ester carboxylesterase